MWWCRPKMPRQRSVFMETRLAFVLPLKRKPPIGAGLSCSFEAEPLPSRLSRLQSLRRAIGYGASLYRPQDLEGTCARLREAGVSVSEIREGRKPGTRVATVQVPLPRSTHFAPSAASPWRYVTGGLGSGLGTRSSGEKGPWKSFCSRPYRRCWEPRCVASTWLRASTRPSTRRFIGPGSVMGCSSLRSSRRPRVSPYKRPLPAALASFTSIPRPQERGS